MHFWSLYFGSIPILVSELILLLGQSLKSENWFYFGPCRQPSNRKLLRDKWSALFANMVMVWSLKYYWKNYLAFLNAMSDLN